MRIYRATAYVAFVAAFLYTVGFLANAVVPRGIDDGPVRPAWLAILINLTLLGVFAIQHSVMARPWFKRHLPPATERSTFVLAATAALILILWIWQPLPTTIWSADATGARVALWALYLAGWAFLLLSTFALGHFELFGLLRDKPGFREPWLYGLIRHPIMVGFFVIFWATPHMSAGHLLFAAASTAYILVGVRFEEHDLKKQLGSPYADYMSRVPRFVPIGRLRRDRTPAGR